MHTSILAELKGIGIVPVIKIQDLTKAEPLARALIEGGLPVAEITFRTAAAPDAIRRIRSSFPDMLIGAGTVLTVEQAKTAMDCGADFIVSPGFNPKVVQWCIDNHVLIIPGISTPSEIELALEMGLHCVKFFPAEQSGGIAKIKAMAAPYGDVLFMPTGGIDLSNMRDYLSFDRVVACGGSFMVKEDLIQNNQFDEIARLCREAVERMLDFSLAHVGIYKQNAQEAQGVAADYANLLQMVQRHTPISTFVGNIIEVMYQPKPDVDGHIAIHTSSVARAMYHLQKRGFAFDMTTAVKNDKGEITTIYFDKGIDRFLVHLVQK